MDIVMWMATGSILGWVAYSYLNYNEERGMVVSLVIGALGALMGGKMLAPLFATAAAAPGDFSAPALMFAAAAATAFLAGGNLVYKRWGV
jgi:uncharacterized membrane protein YeaQ/YmgE (transglycosylase-associated protein family)